jgi:SIR2-like domain
VRIPPELIKNHQRKRLILFAGAGVSHTLGVPMLDVVVQHLVDNLNLSSAHAHTSNFRTLTEYFHLTQSQKLESFYTWMDHAFHPAGLDIRRSVIHELLVDLNFPITYTTNYDRWIEKAFKAHSKRFRKIVSVSDWAACSQDETEIIKFHGDFDDSASIVLTESSFFSRMLFETPLDIRLRSDSLARPFLFIGYSVGDPNIRFVLYRLSESWEKHASREQRPKSFILMTDPDPVQERLLLERGIEPILAEGGRPSEGWSCS